MSILADRNSKLLSDWCEHQELFYLLLSGGCFSEFGPFSLSWDKLVLSPKWKLSSADFWTFFCAGRSLSLKCPPFGYSIFKCGFPSASDHKESACNSGDAGAVGSIPGLGRSPGEGNGYPLQCSCLENSTDRGTWRATVHGVTKTKTRLSDWHFHFSFRGLPELFSELRETLSHFWVFSPDLQPENCPWTFGWYDCMLHLICFSSPRDYSSGVVLTEKCWNFIYVQLTLEQHGFEPQGSTYVCVCAVARLCPTLWLHGL